MGRGGAARRDPSSAPATAAALALAIFAFYLLGYRYRHDAMPVGFDTPWYVWRAEYVGSLGLGGLGTAGRPGHALLAAVVGSVTGLSQLRLAVVLPLVLIAVFALAVGAFWEAAVEPGGSSWAATTVVAGTLVGATRLAGENVANLLNLALVVGALVAVANRLEGRRGVLGAGAMLVAAGLVHWALLAAVGVVLAADLALAAPSSLREAREGVPILRTEAGVLGAVGAGAAAVSLGVLGGLLRAPFRTFELREDVRRYVPKLVTDLRRLWLPLTAPVAALGAVVLGTPGRSAVRGFGRRLLLAWAAVMLGGLVVSRATLRAPPHRFLIELVAVPGAVALAAGVVGLSRWAGRAAGRAVGERGRLVAPAVAVAALAALALPGALRWYRGGPGVWMEPAAVGQAETASRYLAELPPGRPFVVLVGPHGPAGLISVPLKERTIRVALPPDRQAGLHLFVGDPVDLLAGRRTPLGTALARATAGYWDGVRRILASRPPVLILEAFGREQFRRAVGQMGAPVIGPGVALLRGPMPRSAVPAGPSPRPVPRVRAGMLQGAALLALLWASGAGWTRLLLGPRSRPPVLWGLAPVVGAGALVLAGLVGAEAGVRLSGPGGVALFVVITVAGTALAWADARRPLVAGRRGP